MALATLGQIFVQLGDLERAEQILTRTLEVRSPVQFQETTGAVFDTLAQIHLMRGSYERAGEYLRQASDAYGAYGTQTMRWYEWSLKVLGVKLAIRRGAYDEAHRDGRGAGPHHRRAAERSDPGGSRRVRSAVAAGRVSEAERTPRIVRRPPRPARRTRDVGRVPAHQGRGPRAVAARLRPRIMTLRRAPACSTCSASAIRRRSATSRSAVSRRRAGTRASAERYLEQAATIFADARRGARSDAKSPVVQRRDERADRHSGGWCRAADADEAVVRRLVDAAILPELLARETATGPSRNHRSRCRRSSSSRAPGGDVRVVAAAGCDADVARALARAASQGTREYGDGLRC